MGVGQTRGNASTPLRQPSGTAFLAVIYRRRKFTPHPDRPYDAVRSDLFATQAVSPEDVGDLSDAQVERIGTTLMLLEEKMGELREHFDPTPEDLNIDLGPLGPFLADK